MIELTARHYDELCRGEPVRSRIGAAADERQEVLRRFWTSLAVGIFASLVAGYLVGAPFGWILAVTGIGASVIVAYLPLRRATEELKHPVLEAIAAQCGMQYMADGFDPPVMPDAVKPLFGSFTGSKFTDLFWGEDEEGRRFAVYEARLERSSGKSSQVLFSGQVHAFQLRRPGSGVTVIRPDWGVFNLFKPQRGMERVEVKTDNAFEKKFAAYGTDAAATRRLLSGGDLRRKLLQLRGNGRVFVYVGPEDALVAVWGRNRFEPGSLFSRRSGAERVRAMFEDVRTTLADLRELRAALG